MGKNPNDFTDKDENVGLISKIEWYRARSRWAREPFILILKRAVKRFNEAKLAKEIGLPHVWEARWNKKHPDQQLEPGGTHVSADSPLANDYLQMSEYLRSQYLVHG